MKKLATIIALLLIIKTTNAQRAFGYDIPKKIDFTILSGTWTMKKSKDLKLFT